MKIHFLSDLHLEFTPYASSVSDVDVIVLAGDIHTKTQGISWISNTFKNVPVIYVLGNHEYYGESYPKLIRKLKDESDNSNIYILENEVVTLDGVNFLGCTLWTDFALYGDPRIAGYHCQQMMTDYKKIKRSPSYSKMRSIDTALIHKQSRAWLRTELASRSGECNVVVTHHAPSIKSLAAQDQDDMTSAAYASNLETDIHEFEPSLWLHGHVHSSNDYLISNCRVVTNPRGYHTGENQNFDPNLILDVNP